MYWICSRERATGSDPSRTGSVRPPSTRDPPRLDTLAQCLEALLATPTSHAALAELAPRRCAAVAPTQCADRTRDRGGFVLWWCAWLAVDPPSILEMLDASLARIPGNADELMLSICGRLWRLASDARLAFPLPRAPTTLIRLLSTVIAASALPTILNIIARGCFATAITQNRCVDTCSIASREPPGMTSTEGYGR